MSYCQQFLSMLILNILSLDKLSLDKLSADKPAIDKPGMNKLKKLLGVLAISLLLSACGFKGDLYLPDSTQASEPTNQIENTAP